MGVLHDHRNGEVVVRNLVGHAVKPGVVALGKVHEVAHDQLAAFAKAVRPLVADADPAFAMRQELVLRHGGHELARGAVQRVARHHVVEIGLEHLELALCHQLAAVAVLAVGDVTIVAVIGELHALPAVHHIHQILDTILGPQHAHVDQPFATEQIEAREGPAHRQGVCLAAHVARAVAAFLHRHARLDLAQQRRVAVVRVGIRQHHVRRYGEELRFLGGAGHAQPVRLVGQQLHEVVGLEQLRVGDRVLDGVVCHCGFLRRTSRFPRISRCLAGSRARSWPMPRSSLQVDHRC